MSVDSTKVVCSVPPEDGGSSPTSTLQVSHQRKIRDEQANLDSPLAEWHDINRSIENGIVREISYNEAKPIIEQYEWLGTMPAIVFHCFGIFFDNICGGVVVYGVEYAENLGVWNKYGYTGKIICLARGACTHWAHEHTGSKLIRQSMKMLPERFKIITCTVDATAGEVGTIYQACGFDFVGQMSKGGNRASIITEDGKHLSNRQAYQLYGTRSIKKLREMGFTVVSVPRKARYFAFTGSKKEKRENRKAIEHLIKPYPKRVLQDSIQPDADYPQILSEVQSPYRSRHGPGSRLSPRITAVAKQTPDLSSSVVMIDVGPDQYVTANFT